MKTIQEAAMFSLSLIGWLHTLSCIFAMIAGAIALFAVKGSADHKRWGRWYVYVMLSTNVSALLIYANGQFNIFHWMAIGTLVILLLGWYAAPRQGALSWAVTHSSCMLWSYYLLYGGLINESFLRLPALWEISPMFGADGLIFGMIQMVVLFVFFAIWLFFILRTCRLYKHKSLAAD